MRALIDNQTRFPTTSVRQAVRWCLREFDVDLPSVVVRVEPFRKQRAIGRFYAQARTRRPRVWAAHSPALKISEDARHLLVVRTSDFLMFGHRKMRGGPPKFSPQNWVENLIGVTAHEAMHLKQFLFPRSGRPKFSEVEAEWASYRLLKKWRERKGDE